MYIYIYTWLVTACAAAAVPVVSRPWKLYLSIYRARYPSISTSVTITIAVERYTAISAAWALCSRESSNIYIYMIYVIY